MTLTELQIKLIDLDISPGSYSLQGDLESDRIIVRAEHGIWKVFYFDERGNRNEGQDFDSESKACEYVYEYFVREKEFTKKYGVHD